MGEGCVCFSLKLAAAVAMEAFSVIFLASEIWIYLLKQSVLLHSNAD